MAAGALKASGTIEQRKVEVGLSGEGETYKDSRIMADANTLL